jgi:large subunit ribosomal protein L22
MEVRAVAKYIGISPKKMRLVASEVKGKDVAEALDWLRLLPSPSAKALAKVIKSASANAENNFQMLPQLRIAKILVEPGASLKRFRAQARGRASPILKRSCHITVVVEEE